MGISLSGINRNKRREINGRIRYKKVFTDTKCYPLSIIKEMFDDGDRIPQPDY